MPFRDPERHREGQRRYNRSPQGKIRSKAKRKAQQAVSKIHHAEYQELYQKFLEEGLEKWEKEQGLIQ